MIEKKKTYSIKEAADLLECGRTKIYNLADEGKLTMSSDLPRRITAESIGKYYASLFDSQEAS